MLEDVRLALNGARPVEFYSRVGGNVPSHDEVLRFIEALVGQDEALAGKNLAAMSPEEEQSANV